MNTILKNSALSLALIAATSLTFASAASAQERGRQVTVSGSNGKSATSTTQKGVSNGTYNKTKSVQTGSGKGYTKSKSGSYDQNSGTVYRNGSVTNNKGGTVSKNSQASCDNGVCENSKTYVGPNGNTAGSDTTRYIDENGKYVKDKTYTGANGNTANKNVTRDGKGEKTTTTTSPKGESRQRTRWVKVN